MLAASGLEQVAMRELSVQVQAQLSRQTRPQLQVGKQRGRLIVAARRPARGWPRTIIWRKMRASAREPRASWPREPPRLRPGMQPIDLTSFFQFHISANCRLLTFARLQTLRGSSASTRSFRPGRVAPHEWNARRSSCEIIRERVQVERECN